MYQLTLISDCITMEIPRDRYLDRLVARKHNGMVKIITGVHGCGKSYLLFDLFREHLVRSGVDDSHIIAIALDSEENEEYRDVKKLHDRILSSIGDDSMHYILLDGIRLVQGFEAMINSLLRNDNLDIYVTGSNSGSLSSDVITEFRGRGDEINVKPLSFSDFLRVYEGDAMDALDEYMDRGGLPALARLDTEEERRTYLDGIVEACLADIREFETIRRPELPGDLFGILSSTSCSLVNPSVIRDALLSREGVSADEETVSRYIKFLENAYLFEEANRYDIKGRKYIGALEKYYPVDHGIANAGLDFRRISDRPHIMENIVYNELRSRGYEVDIGVVRFRRMIDGKMTQITTEVDFIARKGSRTTYVQSAYRIDDPDKREQELRSLMKINDFFRKVVIVGDSMKPNMDENGILCIGLMQFLTDENSLDA